MKFSRIKENDDYNNKRLMFNFFKLIYEFSIYRKPAARKDQNFLTAKMPYCEKLSLH